MRKPDGYVYKNWRKINNPVIFCTLMEDYEPVCLVDPKLLDWVEKVRTHFQEEHRGKPELLSELEAIMPKEK